MENSTALIISERFQHHETGTHPENAGRVAAIEAHLRAEHLLDDRPLLVPDPAAPEDIALIHDPAYIRLIERMSESGGGHLDADTLVSSRTYDTALLAAGAGLTAVDTVMTGKASRVFVFPRPPGHHAERARGMGFCIFNNVAVAAMHAIERQGARRVAIIDWDVHHGNGTQAAFYDSDQVLFVSLHQWPLYPGTGWRDEAGRGYGQGLTVNVPLAPGTGDDLYLRAFDEVIGPKLLAFRPDLILISAGYDAHQADPLALMSVTEAGFAEMARRVRVWADRLCDGRLVLVLEGGYNQRALVRSVAATIRALDHPDDREGTTA